MWNDLPEKVAVADTITGFKILLTRYMDKNDLEEYGPKDTLMELVH